jgi:MADS-box transcription enhancer factor 2
LQTLNKKEHKAGCESPETDDQQLVLTPRTEEKYQKINHDFDLMLQQRTSALHGARTLSAAAAAYASPSMPVSIPTQNPAGTGTYHPPQPPTPNNNTLMPPSSVPPSLSPRPSSTGRIFSLFRMHG